MENQISKPFDSGKCRLCHSPEYLSQKRLCLVCDRYATQDHVPNRTSPTGSVSQRLSIQDFPHDQWGVHYEEDEWEHYRNRFYLLLKDTGLSAQQRQIAKLHFCENLSFFEISKRLEISKGCAWVQFKRALKKLQFCMTNPLLVRERESRVRPERYVFKAPTEKILPVKFYQPDENGKLRLTQILHPTKRKNFARPPSNTHVYGKCPRCNAKACQLDQDFYYCMDCLWNSDDDSALTFRPSVNEDKPNLPTTELGVEDVR